MTKILATADNHAGKHDARLSRVPGERLGEQVAVWARTLELAREHDVDVILHGGDLFDARRPSPDVIAAVEVPLVAHLEAGGAPIVFVLGNHERLGDGPTAPGVLGVAGLIDYHDRPGVVEHGGISIVCLPSVTAARPVAASNGADRDEIHQEVAEGLLEIARGHRAQIAGPAVLLCHFPISGDADGISQFVRDTVIPLEGLEDLGYDAIVAGDFHRPQLLESSIGRAQGPILYAGSPQPLDFGEGGYEHGAWILELGEPPVFVSIESRDFVTVDLDVTDWGDQPEWPAVLPPEISGAYVKIRVKATSDQAYWIDVPAMRQEALDAGAHNVWVEPTIVREARARVEGLDESLSDREALELWVGANVEGDEARKGEVLDAGSSYLEGAVR